MASSEAPAKISAPELNNASIPEVTIPKTPAAAKEGPPSPPTCKVILAQTIAKPLLQEVSAGLAQLGRRPLLVGFLANDDPAAKAYAEYSAKTCREK
jgi:methylenetetrahydrofolate dehydrogenase (NAD+)